MINIDFSLAISLYILLILGILLVFWIFSRKQRYRELSLDPRFIWFCSICTYTYINTRDEKITTCPRCGSYNKK